MKNVFYITTIIYLVTNSCNSNSNNKEPEVIRDNIVKKIDSSSNNNIISEKKTDSTNYIIVKEVFNDYIIRNNKYKDSLLLFKKYNCKISKKNNPVVLFFNKCTVFNENMIVSTRFMLLDTIEWQEEALTHKNVFYEYNNYIISFNYIGGTKCLNKSAECIIQNISIYRKEEYIEKARNSNSSKYSLKFLKE